MNTIPPNNALLEIGNHIRSISKRGWISRWEFERFSAGIALFKSNNSRIAWNEISNGVAELSTVADQQTYTGEAAQRKCNELLAEFEGLPQVQSELFLATLTIHLK